MAEKHFYEQEEYTDQYLIPYLKRHLTGFDNTGLSILEVGCAEGGSISSLLKLGYQVDGIEIEEGRAAIALDKLRGRSKIVVGDITRAEQVDMGRTYDLIIMRDVIKHIEDKATALANLHAMMKEGGHLFITFPLKYSPYAAHQQNARSWLK